MLWAAIVVTVAVVAVWWWSRDAVPATGFVTQPVERGPLTVTVSATGSLAPTNKVDVGSELSGIVTAVLVDFDDRVRAGQVLARLDTTKLAAQATQAGASLASARAMLLQRTATVEETEGQLGRMQELYQATGGQAPSQQELDAQGASLRRAEADRANAGAAIAQAEAALQAIRTDLGKMVIRSPINGVVLTRSVDPGQTVAASFQAPVLFTIAEDLTKMELTVNVDEADVGRVTVGQEATFTVDAYPDRAFAARVASVRFASETVSGVVTYPTVLLVDNPDLLLRPGMTATAEIVVRRITDAVLVPNAALRFEPPRAAGATGSASSSNGGVLGRLLPRPPQWGGESARVTSAARRVWIERNGEAVPVEIVTGATNDVMTEVVRGDLVAGARVIVDATGGGPRP